MTHKALQKVHEKEIPSGRSATCKSEDQKTQKSKHASDDKYTHGFKNLNHLNSIKGL